MQLYISTARYTPETSKKITSTAKLCKTRTQLLDRLAGALAVLGHMKLDLTASQQEGDVVEYEAIRAEIERLRSECNGIRSELEHHRALHGC